MTACLQSATCRNYKSLKDKEGDAWTLLNEDAAPENVHDDTASPNDPNDSESQPVDHDLAGASGVTGTGLRGGSRYAKLDDSTGDSFDRADREDQHSSSANQAGHSFAQTNFSETDV